MRRNTEAKQRAGFGEFVELPSCIYAVGCLLGILDYYQDIIYYVLLTGVPDEGCHYVRCKRWRPHEKLYIPGPLHPWNDHERNGTFIPAENVARVVYFSRGMFNRLRYDAIVEGQEGRTCDQERVRLYRAYIFRLDRLISRHRFWNLELAQFVQILPDSPRKQEMITLIERGDFDMMNAEVCRIKTGEAEPAELGGANVDHIETR